jgi:Ca2+-binding RTX toxin-like protein
MAIINGTNSGETLNGSVGNDTINALGGNDILFGDLGRDKLNGDNGDDRFDITDQSQIEPDEQYNGGLGFDTLFLNTSNTINLSSTDIGNDVERLLASGQVLLKAAQLGNFINVQTGAITLTSGGTANLSGATVFTNVFNLDDAGNNLNLDGVTSTSFTVNGGNGDDIVTGGENGDALNGGAGKDNLNGGAGFDTLFGGAGKDDINGGSGNDRMVITTQSEIVAGESYKGGTGVDKLDLETGSAIDISSLSIDADVEQLEANGPVLLRAAQLGNFTSVNTGVITLTTGGIVDLSGATVFTNTFTLDAAGNTFDLSGVNTTGYTVNGAGGNDVIIGGERGNTLSGGGGDDKLTGGGSDDTLIGGAGTDTVKGGAGNDRMIITAGSEIGIGESYSGGSGFDKLDLETTASLNISRLTINDDVEQLESNGAVSLTAAQLQNFVFVNTGAIKLATPGTVTLAGHTIFTNTFTLNADGNTFDLTGVNSTSYTVNGAGGDDIITGGDNGDGLNGGGGNDALSGGAGNDTLFGGAGKDNVKGDGGDDRMIITAQSEIKANESYSGGTGFDKLDLETSATINISPLAIGGDVEQLESGGAVLVKAGQLDKFAFVNTSGAITLTSAGTADLSGSTVFTNTFNLSPGGNTLNLRGLNETSYTVNGGIGDDIVTGGDFNDTLHGGAGNDTLNGGLGDDSLFGDAGKDKFLFDTDLGFNVDRIFDFDTVDDKILLSGGIFTEAGAPGTLASSKFFVGTTAHDSSDRIIYNSGTGALLYDPDGSGATGGTQFATLSAGLGLQNTNFTIV